MNIPNQIEPTIPSTNALDFMTVAANLSLKEDLRKKDTSLLVLKLTALMQLILRF